MTQAQVKTDVSAKVLTRKEIRDQIFTSNKFESRVIMFFGAEIEIRQPSLEQILDAQEKENKKEQTTDLIIGYTYVPGTNERVFDPADRDSLLGMPFSADMMAIVKAMSEMTAIDVEGEEKN